MMLHPSIHLLNDHKLVGNIKFHNSSYKMNKKAVKVQFIFFLISSKLYLYFTTSLLSLIK